MGRSRLGYSGRGRRRLRADLRGRPRRYAPGVLRRSNRLPLNTNQVICTVDKKQKFEAEFDVRIGRGFFIGDENKRADMSLGIIPIDSMFSPITRVKYSVENTRGGQRTDYEKLILEIWTDGRITPDGALLQASAILRHHLDLFVNYDDSQIEFDETPDQRK